MFLRLLGDLLENVLLSQTLLRLDFRVEGVLTGDSALTRLHEDRELLGLLCRAGGEFFLVTFLRELVARLERLQTEGFVQVFDRVFHPCRLELQVVQVAVNRFKFLLLAMGPAVDPLQIVDWLPLGRQPVLVREPHRLVALFRLSKPASGAATRLLDR